MPTVLVADDDRKIVDMLRRTLTYEGYTVVTALDGQGALDQALAARPDVIILDWMMPAVDGVEVARRIKSVDTTPILMLTARDSIDNRVEGLDAGADDYLVKPFASPELLARVRALLRRSETNGRERPLVFADLSLDPATREGRRGARKFSLTPKEYDLLAYLLRHPRQVLSRDTLLEGVWGYDFGGQGNTLEVYIGYIRAKSEADGEPRLIQTVRGVGYVLREEP